MGTPLRLGVGTACPAPRGGEVRSKIFTTGVFKLSSRTYL